MNSSLLLLLLALTTTSSLGQVLGAKQSHGGGQPYDPGTPWCPLGSSLAQYGNEPDCRLSGTNIPCQDIETIGKNLPNGWSCFYCKCPNIPLNLYNSEL